MLGGALENQSKSGSPRGAISWPTSGPSAVSSLPTPAALITSTRPLPCLALPCRESRAEGRVCSPRLSQRYQTARAAATPLSRRDPALTEPQRDAASRQKPDADRCRIGLCLRLFDRNCFVSAKFRIPRGIDSSGCSPFFLRRPSFARWSSNDRRRGTGVDIYAYV